MQKLFSMSDLGLLTYYLVIKVKQNDDMITLCQSSYVYKILKLSGMADCIASRYMEAPTMQHMAAVKNILRYVNGTADFGCYYKRHIKPELELVGFSDSDLVGNLDDRKSTIGMVFFLGASLITWASRKQKIVAFSSCEAEYITAATAACQGM
ncbi:uncharacterized mitochondrial protein AtMg00810-like [Dioscorea cayenensis subsp. rotundata]|uniref:Uncharacterized mitochondrial protein AtMg00810-like n=1 Tax=Dioscorea cayennensis subsp. rotundata TaxID=55577 RepID=A0AB40BNQ4_DIOCR|nr:uncharacterized mitochondrial protein AtMg00810-like [Dioscorea cayenensis subsp. rotundata]